MPGPLLTCFQYHDRRAPAAAGLVRKAVGGNVRQLRQQGMHGLALRADALAVDDAHLQDVALQASFEIVPHNILDLLGPEGVQVQRAVDGKFDRIGHEEHDNTGMLRNPEGFSAP